MIISQHHAISDTQGDFSPALSPNGLLDEFLSFDIGMFIHFGMPTFMNTDIYVINQLNDPPAPSNFAAPAIINSAQWATQAANLGCKYAVLTISHQIGFNLFPYTGVYNGGVQELTYDSNRGQLTAPLYSQYDITQTSADQSIIQKFKDQCAIEGIKFGVYYNTGKQINVRRGLDLIDATYDQTNTFSLTYENYIEYVKDELRYICVNYKPDYIWCDAPHHFPRYKDNDRNNPFWFQEIYNTIKTYSRNTLAFINYDCAVIGGDRVLLPNGADPVRPPFSWAGDEQIVFPSDIHSFEHTRPPTNTAELNPLTSHKGTIYYQPKEIVSTIYDSGQYFSRNDNFGALKSAATLQSEYDLAKNNNIPYMLNVGPDRNGNIRTVDISRFGDIVL